MNINVAERIILIVLSLSVGYIIGELIGLETGALKVERAACDAGIGEYYIDANYNIVFRFKEVK